MERQFMIKYAFMFLILVWVPDKKDQLLGYPKVAFGSLKCSLTHLVLTTTVCDFESEFHGEPCNEVGFQSMIKHASGI